MDVGCNRMTRAAGKETPLAFPPNSFTVHTYSYPALKQFGIITLQTLPTGAFVNSLQSAHSKLLKKGGRGVPLSESNLQLPISKLQNRGLPCLQNCTPK